MATWYVCATIWAVSAGGFTHRPESSGASRVAGFVSGLEAGGVPTERVTLVQRLTGGDPTLLEPMAAELVARKVDLIFAVGPPAVRAARAATTSIPIVAGDLESDPLTTGFIAADSTTGRQCPGVYLDFPDFGKKWLQALKEAIPQISSVAVLWDPATGPRQRQAIEGAAAELGLQVAVVELQARDDLERAMQSAVRQRVGGLVVL